MPRITEKAAKQAADIHTRMRENVERARNDRNLSDEGRARLLSRAYVEARDAMASLRQEFEAEQSALSQRLSREVFGATSTSGMDAISLRDGMDRVAQLKSGEEAAALMQVAQDNGDEVLARLIAQQAHRQSATLLGGEWKPVLHSYLAERPDVAAKLEQLEGATAGRLSFGVSHDPEAHFFLTAPRELEQVPPGLVETYATEDEVQPAETQADRNRAIGRTVQQSQGWGL